MNCPVPTLAFLAALFSFGGCMPEPESDRPPTGSRRVPITPVPCPATDAALARGPSLRLGDSMFEQQEDVLAKLQDALTRNDDLQSANTELTARLRVAEQGAAARQAELDEFRKQVTVLSEELKVKASSLVKARTELAAAKATVDQLQPRAGDAERLASQALELRKKCGDAQAANDTLRNQVLEAELARVRAQQDLVALQIVMARQKALLKPRPKPVQAKAPRRPGSPAEEITQ